MSSVIRRYLSWELLQYWLVFTLVLWLVLVTARFSLYLGQAAGGELPAGTVLYLLGLKSVGFFVFLLPVTLFLALLWLLGRLNRDYETLAMGASGIGLLQLYRAFAAPVLLVALLVAVLSLLLVPRTAQLGYQLRADSQRQLDAQALTAGRFHLLRGGRWLLYAQRAGAAAGQLDDVFVHVQRPGRAQVLVARHALVRKAENTRERFLVLQDGYRYDGEPGLADYRVLHYNEYALRLSARPADGEQKWDAVATAALWTRPASRGARRAANASGAPARRAGAGADRGAAGALPAGHQSVLPLVAGGAGIHRVFQPAGHRPAVADATALARVAGHVVGTPAVSGGAAGMA